jgi:hypothetical protein
MAEIKVCFRPIIGYEYLAMLGWGHGTGVYIQIGVKLAKPDLIAACLKQSAECRRAKPFTKRRDNTTSDKDKTSHRPPSKHRLVWGE